MQDVRAVVEQLWVERLGVEPPAGDHDDFFLLGGDSLLAVALVTQLEDVLQIVFPLEEFFQYGTFGATVAACSEQMGQGT